MKMPSTILLWYKIYSILLKLSLSVRYLLRDSLSLSSSIVLSLTKKRMFFATYSLEICTYVCITIK